LSEVAPLRQKGNWRFEMPMPQPTLASLVVADSHAIVREGLAALCASLGWNVLARCSDAAETLQTIQRLDPDFAILDLQPPLTNMALVRDIRSTGLRSRLFVLSAARNESIVIETLRAGADAYLLKDGPSRHLVDALNFVRDGGVYVSPLLGGAALFIRDGVRAEADPLASLSQRERQVFTHLVNGLRAKDVAERLKISPKTVDTYRATLMRKLSLRDMVGLVRYAIEKKLISADAKREWE
jgi:DNA-binding NarL/FixJ family response regulator